MWTCYLNVCFIYKTQYGYLIHDINGVIKRTMRAAVCLFKLDLVPSVCRCATCREKPGPFFTDLCLPR